MYSKSGSSEARGQDNSNFVVHSASAYQVEGMITGGKSEKTNGSDDSPSSPVSGQVTPYGEPLNFGSVEEGKEPFGYAEYSAQGRGVPPSPKGLAVGGVECAITEVS